MIEDVREKVSELLSSGRIQGFLGLSHRNGHIGPYLFMEDDDLGLMSLGDWKRPGDSRYPLAGILRRLIRHDGGRTFGVLVRGCDERGLRALMSLNQLPPDRVETVGIACPPELAEACECRTPYPEKPLAGKKSAGVEGSSVSRLDALDTGGRFEFWSKEFSRCVKCYGCAAICPVCFCDDCSLRCGDLIRTGEIPPAAPIFHLVRAADMAGRCIDCGLCQEACPGNIPLRTLYKKVADIMAEEFDYRPGSAVDGKSPLHFLGVTAGETV